MTCSTWPIYDSQQHRAHALIYGQDPRGAPLCGLALALWLQGYSEQARTRAQEAYALATEVSHPLSLVFAQHDMALFYLFRKEAHITCQLPTCAIALATEQSFSSWLAAATFLQGWARTCGGRKHFLKS